jgi:fucose permease
MFPSIASKPPVASTGALSQPAGRGLIRVLTFLMFLMFATTTDSIGVIIPQAIREFRLSMALAGSLHYAGMIGIALGGLSLGALADRIGRKGAIVLGLSAFAATAFLFAVGRSFSVFIALLFVSGLAIGVFKTGALALIGDISSSTRGHTATMNLVEGFFGVGTILGPAGVTLLLSRGASWKWIFVIAGAFCLALIVPALRLRAAGPAPAAARPKPDLLGAYAALANPWTFAFSVVVMLYVGVEAAISVWAPTLLADYRGPAPLLAAYALSVFFSLRTLGRFLGPWTLNRAPWTAVLAVCSFAILACFLAAVLGGRAAAVWALPASGLFMSVIYPTLNS